MSTADAFASAVCESLQSFGGEWLSAAAAGAACDDATRDALGKEGREYLRKLHAMQTDLEARHLQVEALLASLGKPSVKREDTGVKREDGDGAGPA